MVNYKGENYRSFAADITKIRSCNQHKLYKGSVT